MLTPKLSREAQEIYPISPSSNSPPTLESKYAARSLDPAYSADDIPFFPSRQFPPNLHHHTSFLCAHIKLDIKLFTADDVISRAEWYTDRGDWECGTAANKGNES
jgi:hypothetical protein